MNKIRRLSIYVSIIDGIAVTISYFFAAAVYLVVYNSNSLFFKESVLQTFIMFLIAFSIAEVVTNNKNRLFLERSGVQEIFNVAKMTVLMGILFAFLTFISKTAFEVSRGVFVITLIVNLVIGVILRNLLKLYFRRNIGSWKAKTIVITTFDSAEKFHEILKDIANSFSEITGFAIIDKSMIGSEIYGIRVVADYDSVVNYSRTEIVDSALVMLHNGWWEKSKEIVESLQSMGIVVHLGVEMLTTYTDLNRTINHIGNYPVLSVAEATQSQEQLIFKRTLDIIGGVVGVAITLVVALVLGPIIKLESPGPVFFKQKRVGKNGRYFYIYKFRSMGVDAEQRKKDLISQNEVTGHMFKMTNDPRVTKVGKFIRATSIDELPQFFNVLKGDMSLVGTRPPTVDEFKQYKTHHKRRLSMKPGITGMWQVSGRSDITDFDEVVRLDTNYIDNYSLALDIKILLKTVVVVFVKVGSR